MATLWKREIFGQLRRERTREDVEYFPDQVSRGSDNGETRLDRSFGKWKKAESFLFSSSFFFFIPSPSLLSSTSPTFYSNDVDFVSVTWSSSKSDVRWLVFIYRMFVAFYWKKEYQTWMEMSIYPGYFGWGGHILIEILNHTDKAAALPNALVAYEKLMGNKSSSFQAPVMKAGLLTNICIYWQCESGAFRNLTNVNLPILRL